VELNGREWLAQQMRREGMTFPQAGNCIVRIEDYAHAQALLDTVENQLGATVEPLGGPAEGSGFREIPGGS